jgi:outer membrane scaffolding protein for murein synthesis (MipA/OmpV family)
MIAVTSASLRHKDISILRACSLQSRVFAYVPAFASYFRCWSSFACALGAPAALHAEDSTPLPAPQEWIVTLRANDGFAPNYEGSKDISPYVLPGLGIWRPNSIVGFSTPDEAPGFTLFDNGRLRGGLNGQMRGPRHQSDYRELNGIHDIDWRLR